MKIAVFGSLMAGNEHHDEFLDEATYLGEFNSEPKYNLYKMGKEPVIKLEGISSVRMEVFRLSKANLNNIGALRGFIKNNHADNVTNRKVIITPYGRALLFAYNGKVDKLNMIPTGDWKDYKSYAKIQ